MRHATDGKTAESASIAEEEEVRHLVSEARPHQVDRGQTDIGEADRDLINAEERNVHEGVPRCQDECSAAEEDIQTAWHPEEKDQVDEEGQEWREPKIQQDPGHSEEPVSQGQEGIVQSHIH